MDKFLEIMGMIIVTSTLLMMVAVQLYAGGGAPVSVLLGSATWGVPSIVGGVILAAFGNMLGELRAIRHTNDAQLKALHELAIATRNLAAKPPAP